MRSRGKKYKEMREALKDLPCPVELGQAIGVLKQFNKTKFNQTVELVIHLGIDPRQSDQLVRGSIALPKGIGKSRKVIVFCEGEQVDQAKEAGALEAGGADLVKKIEGGWMDFDVAIAAPSMMRVVGKLGRILGPQGKMPSPKAGTVTNDVITAVKEYSAGKLEFRNDSGGNVHIVVGRLNFSEEDLMANIESFVSHIKRIKPSATKGTYLKKASISATMSPGIEVAVA